MRENKRKLKFKKIKIANMNSLRGGGETDTVVVADSDGCPPEEATNIYNPCSDGCVVSKGPIINTDGAVNTGAGIGICNYPIELCNGR